MTHPTQTYGESIRYDYRDGVVGEQAHENALLAVECAHGLKAANELRIRIAERGMA